jgi:hypothetical protein
MKIEDIVHPIRQDYLSGMSFTAIGVKYGVDPRTAKRYAIYNIPLEQLGNRQFNSVLDPYKTLIDEWLLNGSIFATIIHDRLIEQGCDCGYTIVNDYVRKKIDEYEKLNLYKKYNYNKKDELSIDKKINEEKKLLHKRRKD